jgi:hypothetical protein
MVQHICYENQTDKKTRQQIIDKLKRKSHTEQEVLRKAFPVITLNITKDRIKPLNGP